MRLLAGLLIAALLSLVPALAQDKPLRGVALVIGQSDYSNMPALKNPANDAAAMEDLLRRLGFDVTSALDNDQAALTAASPPSRRIRPTPMLRSSTTLATASKPVARTTSCPSTPIYRRRSPLARP
jgi:hypothetical protein